MGQPGGQRADSDTLSAGADSPRTGGAAPVPAILVQHDAAVLGLNVGSTYGAMTTKEGQFIPVSGPKMVRRGVGDPDLKSWCGRTGRRWMLLKLETHRSPKGSTATP